MKLFMGVLFATLALSGVLSLPGKIKLKSTPELDIPRVEDAEVIGEPRTSDTDTVDDGFGATHFSGVVDTGSVNPFLQSDPLSVNFGFFKPLTDFFNSLLTRLPTGSSESNEDDLGPLNIPALDTKKANSSSTVKVVDGHKVEINETIYGDENNVFRVRLVNIRPLEEDETVEDASPVTQGPNDTASSTESHESDEKREPLEKKPSDNEIQGNIDQPEEKQHSIAKKENIVETTAATEIDTTMLPTAEDINAAFVTDNGLEQQEYSAAVTAEEELNGVSGNGNNEFETNMSGENNNNHNSNNNSNNNDHDDNNFSDDNIDKVENVEAEHTIENNEDTEEEANDNLNESSSSNSADVSDKEQVHNDNDNNDEDVVDVAEAEAETDIEVVNLQKKNSNYLAVIRNREREGESSSDDEDASAMPAEMHPTFNDEWGNLNEATNEQNDFVNDIDVYDALPIDLSNDIAVNDAANLPLNPDAEFIDVYGLQHSSNTMPKFEKLSLNYQLPPSREDWTSTPTK